MSSNIWTRIELKKLTKILLDHRETKVAYLSYLFTIAIVCCCRINNYYSCCYSMSDFKCTFQRFERSNNCYTSFHRIQKLHLSLIVIISLCLSTGHPGAWHSPTKALSWQSRRLRRRSCSDLWKNEWGKFILCGLHNWA